MQIQAFYDPATYTLTYAVWDEATKDAVVIDPVLDYDPATSQTSIRSLREVEDFVLTAGLKVHYILETHAHADHLSGSQYLKAKLGADIVIGEKITVVQETFRDVFHLPEHVPVDGSQFDQLVRDGDTLKAGSLAVNVIATPGHTPACVTYRIGDAVFTGDTLFMHDYGTGRCDFPAGSAFDLYDSVQKLYALPDATRVFVGHDYQPGGRELEFETTIGKSKQCNPQLSADTSKDEFVKFRTVRDRSLTAPRLLLPSVQVNIDAGRLPHPSENGRRYLRLPLNLFRPTDDLGEELAEAAQ